METVFLIGGSGFIGKNLAQYLSQKYHVHVFDKYIDQPFFTSCPSIETTELDLVSQRIPQDVPSPDYIINLASIVTAERNMSLFDELISSNLKILLNLYERFKEESLLKLFVQFGSSEEYGSEQSPFREEDRECPNSPYALVKQLTTNTSMMLYRNYGFPIMVVRPGNLFGPLQNKDKFIPYVVGKYQNTSKFIPYILEKLRKNEEILTTFGEQKRDFIYVDDFACAIESLLQNHFKCLGEIVNVSSGESISLKQIIEHCKAYLHSSSDVNYGALPYRENEAMDLKCSIAKLSSITGCNIHFDNEKRLTDYLKQ